MSRRRLWWDRSVRFKGLVVVAIPLAALCLSAFLYVGAARDAQTQSGWVADSLLSLRQMDEVVELTRDTDGSLRSYALAGDPALRERANDAMGRLMPALDDLVDLLPHDPAQQRRADELRPLLAARIALARQRWAAFDVGDPDADDLFLRAVTLTNEIRDRVTDLRATETQLLAEQRAAAETATQSLNLRALLLLATGMAGGIAGAVLFSRSIARRLDQVTANAEHLAAEEPIIPGEPAADEIGRLDAALVQASELLAARRARESAAAEEARRANEAKTQFLSRMSHELRTPLNAVIGFAQVLELGDLDPSEQEAVDHIRQGGAHLLELINEVLDLSRIESGVLSISPEPVAIDEAIADVVTLMQPAAAAAGITLTDESPAEACGRYVIADRHRLKQVLLNLVSNAIKYNRPQGSVTVSCSRPEHDTMRITVTDTGPGISPDKIDLLFTPFERLGAERSNVEGTGIGLSLSRDLAELMGGTLAVDSRPGMGSTFWVELPVAPPTVDEQPFPDEPVTLPAEASPGRVATVLHIEDNGLSAAVVGHILERHGAELLTAEQGYEGIDIARRARPDLILLDLHLPDIEGHDALHMLKRDPSTAPIPVVVLSADATPGTVRRTLQAGAIDFLHKPIDVNHLLSVLAGIERTREASAARRPADPDR